MTLQPIAQLFDLTGKGAIVTGGSKGIGQASAFRLTEAGASVMITATDMKAANETVEKIRSRGGKAEAMHADVQNAADAGKVVEATVHAFGGLDILVNNAGIYPLSPALDITEETWDRVLNVNLKGLFFYSQAAAREMIRAGHRGKIIMMASTDSLHPTREEAPYGASKGGAFMLTKNLALELAPYNILVNAVGPGNIMTPGSLAMRAEHIASGRDIEELDKDFRGRLPLGRVGKSDDVATVVLFLASAAADYMTGSMIIVDGGFMLS